MIDKCYIFKLNLPCNVKLNVKFFDIHIKHTEKINKKTNSSIITTAEN